MKIGKIGIVLMPVALLILAAGGCNSFERNAYNTLATSQSVVDTAQADYEAKTIPQTKCAYAIINDGKAAQTAAVTAFADYEQLKKAKGAGLSAQEAVVIADLATLAPVVVQIQSLVSNPAAACGGAK